MSKGIDKADLQRYLAEGKSLPQIGRLVERDPSTVGYWVKRHGLTANGSSEYSPKGGLSRESLEWRIESGLTVRQIAADLSVSTNRVRYWIRRHGLRKPPGRRDAEVIDAARAARKTSVMRECPRHGMTEFWLGSKKSRCKQCNADGVLKRRRLVKQTLVSEFGGCCHVCGYARSMQALQFHHLDPTQKEFNIAANGHTLGIDRTRQEAAKCVLLCANCHAEVEAGLIDLPLELATQPADSPGAFPG